jgi:phenylpyruvate tautomerase PptA (4-oxalocrotonate tautomerase family)
MPLLHVVTNVVLLQDQKAALAAALQEPISTQLRIPVTHVHVHITDGTFLSYGGDYVTPAAVSRIHQ